MDKKEIIDDLNYLNNIEKEFYKTYIKKRKKLIIDYAYNHNENILKK